MISVAKLFLGTLVGGLALATFAQTEESSLVRAVASGEFAVKSLEEQKLPAAMKDRLREQVRQMREQKVISVEDDRLPDFDAAARDHRARGKSNADLASRKVVSFGPASVDATYLRGSALIGSLPHGIQQGETWTGLSRMFNHPRIGYVVLEETDLAKTGGGVVFTKELVNADVNGAPAVLLSRQGSGKKSSTSLTWFSGGMLYALQTPGTDDATRDELLAIARQITLPKSGK